MKMVRRPGHTALLLPLLLAANPVAADDAPREDRHYAGLLFTGINHRSVGEDTLESTLSTAGTLVVGGHLSEYFHAELRLGGGINEGTIDKELDLDIEHFASWYIGLHYPVTGYANVYGQFGFTHISGDARLTPFGQSREDDPDDSSPYASLEGKYPDSDFSVSWIFGMDFEVFDNTYLLVEGGKLFKDTGTNANAFQFSSGLRYEF